MSKISQESIDKVAAANDIVEVIGSYFPLKRSGTSFRALCPFHTEKSPSFYVHPTRQSFHCFGCGAGGGVFRFVMDYEHIDFPTAVRRLAQRRGIPLLEELTSQDTIYRDQKKRLLDLHRQVALWYHHQLLRSQEAALARSYLKERGFSKEIAIAWQIGYAPAAWETTKKWALAAGFSKEELVTGGLLLERSAGNQYDRFRDRLMFPIRNDYGEVIGFSGRTLSQEAKEAKYLNSPETPLFSKGKILFGLDKSKRALIQAGEAIVMEGQIDLIAAFEHGCHNVVAPQGTAFTAEQAHLLKRFVERVVLCFDADTAGKNAVERSLPALLSNGLEIRIARLPQGEDPDSFLRKEGVAAFQKLITEASDFFTDAIVQAKAEHQGRLTPYQTAGLAKKLGGYLSLLPDATVRELTTGMMATQLGISITALQESFPVKNFFPEQKLEEPLRPPVTKVSAGTELLCRLALLDAEVRIFFKNQTDPSPAAIDPELALLEELLAVEDAFLEVSSEQSLSTLLSRLSPRVQELIASWDLEKKGTDLLPMAQDTWRGFQVAFWKREQAKAIAALKQPGLTAAEILKWQQKILELQQRISLTRELD
ncbi:MAG: DNA primase [Chthoniobacterales bacterium]|nr:DNA primase [Chthoniobacterales bacterium]